MTIKELAVIAGYPLRVSYMNQLNRWHCNIERAEVMRDGFLSSQYGIGNTPEEAIQSYCEKLRGQTIAIDAYKKALRKEIPIPQTLSYE